ncbi:TRAP transporter small permease [Uliginosibacterium sp. H1]|uniref:TRAP transporter small permease n=1 Tax=Uliginosibacterium sp. H1 TaxID=3114757 RepID=UPI002E19F043|nr:TRAP transporter small permease [Uliginosibacterium sp. H1]
MIATFGLGLIILCVLYQVFGRYVMNDTPTWAEALALLLVLYVTMLGTAVGVRDAGHIGMESLLAICPQPYKKWLEIFIHAIVAGFGACMTYNGQLLARSAMDQKIPTLGLPEGLFNIPITIAGVLIALFSIEHIIALVKGVEVQPSWH